MKKLALFIFFVAFLNACKSKTVEPSSTLLSANSWQLERYTDPNGKALANSSLNVSAIALFGLAFEFKADKETRAFDKLTKNIVNRGTWGLLENDNTIDINITSFKGQFKIIKISRGKLTLQASTGSFLSGVGNSINMEFVEFK